MKELICEDCKTTYPEGQYRADGTEWDTKNTREEWGSGCAWCGGASLTEHDVAGYDE